MIGPTNQVLTLFAKSRTIGASNCREQRSSSSKRTMGPSKHNGVNYRMLYFFHGTHAVVVTQGFAKQQAVVPLGEIGLAARRRRAFEANPARHSFMGRS